MKEKAITTPSLPHEIIESIYAFLDHCNDLLSAGLVCKKWHAVSALPRVWDRYIAHRYPRGEDAKTQRGQRIDETRDLRGMEALKCILTSGKCYVCAYGTEKMMKFRNNGRVAYLCSECNKMGADAVIVRTRAKKKYCLTEKDIMDLPYIERDNPRYRRAAPMRLYIHHMVQQRSMRKYGGEKGINERRRKREQIALKRRKTIAMKKGKNRSESEDEW